MASNKPSAGKGPSAALRRLWDAIRKNALKRLFLFVIAIMALTYLTDEELGSTAAVFTGFFVITLLCVSYAYMRIVAPRVHVRIPGLDQARVAELEASAAKGAQEHDAQMTLEILRLDAKAARVTIENDAALPVLRAEASVALVRGDGDRVAQESMGTHLKEMSFSLPARSTIPATLTQTFNHVGIYQLQSMGVRVYDLFGAFSRLNAAPYQWRVRVVPNIYRLAYGIPHRRRLKESDLGIPNHTSDALDYDRVRDWQPGDPLKTIHWKLVAHSRGELYTKLFETSTVTSVLLLLDPYGSDDTGSGADTACHLYDTMLEGGLSLLEHARENGIAGQLLFLNRSQKLVSADWAGPGMRGWLVESAHRPTPGIDARNASLRAIRSLRQGPQGYVIMATSRLSEASVEELITCHHAGIPLLVVHAIASGSGREARQQHAFDERLRSASIAVVALTDGRQIIREVTTS